MRCNNVSVTFVVEIILRASRAFPAGNDRTRQILIL